MVCIRQTGKLRHSHRAPPSHIRGRRQTPSLLFLDHVISGSEVTSLGLSFSICEMVGTSQAWVRVTWK